MVLERFWRGSGRSTGEVLEKLCGGSGEVSRRGGGVRTVTERPSAQEDLSGQNMSFLRSKPFFWEEAAG